MGVNGNCVFRRLRLSFFFFLMFFLWLVSDIIKIIFIQLRWALHLFLKKPHNPSFKFSLYLAALGLLAALVASGSHSVVAVPASHCGGFSAWGVQALGCGLSSCGLRA